MSNAHHMIAPTMPRLPRLQQPAGVADALADRGEPAPQLGLAGLDELRGRDQRDHAPPKIAGTIVIANEPPPGMIPV